MRRSRGAAALVAGITLALAIGTAADGSTAPPASGAASGGAAAPSPGASPGWAAGRKVNDLLTPADGRVTEGLVSLDRGIIGVTGNPQQGYTLVIGSDASRSAVARMAGQGLSRAARDRITIEQSSVSAHGLQTAWGAINRVAASRLDDAYWMDVDPGLAKVVIGVNKRTTSAAAIDALRQAAPGLVAVEVEGGAGRAERSVADPPPHRGGSKIHPWRQPDSYCTAGFTVRRAGSKRRMSVTAGHCGTNGQRRFSGRYRYGQVRLRHGYPTYDMERLQGQKYAAIIRTSGGNDGANKRTVKGAADPVVGSRVCQAGVTSYSECGIRIRSVTASFCDSVGCTRYLMSGRHPDDIIIVRGGDSGGPVYKRQSGGKAVIRGIIIAYGDYGRRMFGERWRIIRNHLKVRIAVGK